VTSQKIGTVSALAGAAVLAAVAWRGILRIGSFAPPPTPLAHSITPFLSPGYGVIRDAGAVIPSGASVVVLAEPRQAGFESHFYRFGLALLPARTVLPAAMFDAFTASDVWNGAEYRIVVGGRPPSPPGDLVLETPDGSVWRRRAS
jgi:hypothetical protein